MSRLVGGKRRRSPGREPHVEPHGPERNEALARVDAARVLRALVPRTRVAMAAVHRTGDVGIDLPAGASAAELEPNDYRPVEMSGEDRPAGPPRRG